MPSSTPICSWVLETSVVLHSNSSMACLLEKKRTMKCGNHTLKLGKCICHCMERAATQTARREHDGANSGECSCLVTVLAHYSETSSMGCLPLTSSQTAGELEYTWNTQVTLRPFSACTVTIHRWRRPLGPPQPMTASSTTVHE